METKKLSKKIKSEIGSEKNNFESTVNIDDIRTPVISDNTLNDENIIRGINTLNLFKKQMKAGIENRANNFTIHTIEKLLGEAKKNINSVVDDILHDEIKNIDEKELIKQKKKNTETKE
jgi:hypothetical protein